MADHFVLCTLYMYRAEQSRAAAAAEYLCIFVYTYIFTCAVYTKMHKYIAAAAAAAALLCSALLCTCTSTIRCPKIQLIAIKKVVDCTP